MFRIDLHTHRHPYALAASLATIPFVPLSLTQYVWLIGFWFIMHIVSTYLGYLGGLRDRPI